MSLPFLLAQLSDPHIGAEWAEADPVAGLTLDSTRPALHAVLDGELASHVQPVH